jgi:pimeloyl-ACP methyl ester carboxylesterase
LTALLAACGSGQSAEDAEREKQCHGPPLESAEERSVVMVAGYSINERFGCIDRQSYEAVERQNAATQAARAAANKNSPAGASTLREARAAFTTTISVPASGTPLPEPPPQLFVRSDYRNPQNRTLAAYVTPDPGDGQKHAAIIWVTGGDSNTLDDFWTEGATANDQSASAYRKAGLVMMFPTLRGGNTDTGGKEFFYGEVDDLLAAADHLAGLPYVDAQYIYLGGHSTGGTLALLTAETSTRFKAVFAFGAVSRMNRYPASLVPDTILENSSENRVRSPIHWLDGISTPTWLIEGAEDPGNHEELDDMCAHTRNPVVHCLSVPGFNHFSVLAHASRVIAARLSVANSGIEFSLKPQDLQRAGSN